MGDSAWKAWERYVADVLGGTRRGPLTTFKGGPSSGLSDISGLEGQYAVECKHGAQMGFGLILDACRQALSAARGDEIPMAAIHRKGDRLEDGIFCIRIGDWKRLCLSLICVPMTGTDGVVDDGAACAGTHTKRA
jgi:hypothetical protein